MGRILYVSQGYSTHDRRFLEALGKSRHAVWFLPFAEDAYRLESRPLPCGIEALPPLLRNKEAPGALDWPALVLRFRRRLREAAPDIVHAGPVQTGAFVAALCKKAPLLVMSWGSDVLVVPDENWRMRRLTRFTLGCADMVLGDCAAVRERVLGLSGLRDDQIVCFPWGIDVGRFMPGKSTMGLRGRLGWEGRFIVIATRGFEAIHAPLVFLEAVKRAAASRPDLGVIMIGDGSLRRLAEEFIARNDLADYVHCPGRVPNPEMADHFREADLYASATLSDGSSVSMLEAMGCGLPVAVVDGYGNREWVVPEENGWLYPAGDADALGRVILEARQKEAQRTRMAHRNRALIEERADWSKNIGRLFDVYERLSG